MTSMDVFKGDAFSSIQLTAAVDKLGFVPQFLGSIPNLFMPVPVRTKTVFIEERDNAPALIQTTPRGTPPEAKGGEKRNVHSIPSVRIARSNRLHADEIQDIRAFGQESELQQVQTEVGRRQLLLRRDVELTHENMRLGAVQGLVTDADGSTLFDWASILGQTIPAEIDFDLDNATPASGAVRKLCNTVTRSILRNLKGLWGNQVMAVGLCGDTFWDDLTAHAEVRETFLHYQAAAELREGNAFESFRYGGIAFTNYRGTDDGSTVSIGTDKCKFFPSGAGIFQMAMSPAETFDWVNTPGQLLYSWLVPDRDRNAWVDVEMFSYPLPVCTVPSALHRAKRT